MFIQLLSVQLCVYLKILNGQLCIIRLLQLLCNKIGHLGVSVVFRVGIRLDEGG